MPHPCPFVFLTTVLARKHVLRFFLLFLGSLLLSLPFPALAQGKVTLAWDASPTEGVAAYNVYYGNSSRNYTGMIEAP